MVGATVELSIGNFTFDNGCVVDFVGFFLVNVGILLKFEFSDDILIH